MAALDQTPVPSSAPILAVERHVEYIRKLHDPAKVGYSMNEHLRLSGVYWGLTALHLLKHPDALSSSEILDFVCECFHPDVGGFGSSSGHDAHLLYTISAIQILATIDAFDEFNRRCERGTERIVEYIASLQCKSGTNAGTFSGDQFGETDTRFLYCAFNGLSLLGRLDAIDVDLSVKHIEKCQNFDGAYGLCPGAESHSGQVFTCVGALSIAGRLDLVDRDRLGEWLCERQLDNGGLNGRPEKREDVCYSWWVLSSLSMIGRLHWIDSSRLTSFILGAQDCENGGISDRAEDMVDVFHTLFGVAGLSLLGYPGLEPVDPVYCMPKRMTSKFIKAG